MTMNPKKYLTDPNVFGSPIYLIDYIASILYFKKLPSKGQEYMTNLCCSVGGYPFWLMFELKSFNYICETRSQVQISLVHEITLT